MIKRYSPEAGFSEPMEIDSLGKWVKHKDHLKEFERLKGGWISVEKEYPPERIDVLIYTEYGKRFTARLLVDEPNFEKIWVDPSRADRSYGSVTHWMPLPEPPEDV